MPMDKLNKDIAKKLTSDALKSHPFLRDVIRKRVAEIKAMNSDKVSGSDVEG